MNIQTQFLHQKLSVYAGLVFVIAFLIFWAWLGENLPPPNASWEPQEFTDRYVNHLTAIRVGFLVSLLTVCFYLPWTGYMTARMTEIEKKQYPVLAYLQLMGGCLTVMVVTISLWCWVVAAQRPERSPEITQLLTDAGWLMLDTAYMCTSLQMFAMAICFLCDKTSKVKVMPTWACYLTLFCAITFFPASLTAIFRDGPFAYHGLLSYWLPYAAWLIWMVITTLFLIKDLNRRQKEALE